jgi:hypothetical protein
MQPNRVFKSFYPLDPKDQLAGFARVVSDFTTLAYSGAAPVKIVTQHRILTKVRTSAIHR